MQSLTLLLTTVFLGFFAMLNPIGSTPVFLSLVGDADEYIIKKVAFKAVLVAFIIIAIFSLFGHLIFKMFGITLPAFQIAGGIIVFFIGYDMLTGKKAKAQQQSLPFGDDFFKNLPPNQQPQHRVESISQTLYSTNNSPMHTISDLS